MTGFWISGFAFFEDLSEHPRLRAEMFEDVAIMYFERIAVFAE